MNAIRPRWLRWAVRGLLVLVGLTLVLALVAGILLWVRVQDQLKTADQAPSRPLASYADEAAPARPPAVAPARFDWASIEAPPRSALPWVRWWWPGGDVEPGELRRELDDLNQANFGGAEIQPFAFGVKGVTDEDAASRARVEAFDTPAYFVVLRGVMKDADARGLQIDLTHYSGWPAGSSAVSAADGLQSLAWSQRRFDGGRRVELALPRPKPSLNALLLAASSPISPMGDISDFDPSRARLVSVVVARPMGGGHNLFSIKDTLRLDPASVQVVDAQVRHGKLIWDAPPGRWVMVASWILPAGQPPMFSAGARPGYAVDVLRARNVRAHYNYAFGRRTGLGADYGGAFRGVFNDSLEFAVDRLGSADILAEFKARRGYDLRPHLPAVYVDAADSFYISEFMPRPAPHFTIGELDERVRYDYQLTLSDLVVERFLNVTRDWAAARGLTSRGQGYGMDVDVLRALGANDIPETEQLYAGGGEAFLRLAGSAAALYGRDLVSAESFVWAGQDYATSPAKLKAAADKLFLSGINHIIYHGFPYDWRRGDRDRWFGPQGWAPFSSDAAAAFSENYSPRNPLWADLPALNTYIGRSQNLLRQGKQAADVLVYYPFLGYRASGYGDAEAKESLFLGAFPSTDPAGTARPAGKTTDERILWLRKMAPVFAELDRRGLTWAWVNGDGLRNQVLPGGRLKSGAPYGAILIADAEAMTPQDLAAARTLQTQGASVALYGRTPLRQPGYLDARTGDARVRATAAALLAAAPPPRTPAALVETIVARTKPSLQFSGASALRRYGRALDDGVRIDFIANENAAPAGALIVTDDRSPAWWFDAQTGQAAPAVRDRDGRIALSLQGYGSRFLIRGRPKPAHLLGSPLLNAAVTGRSWPVMDWSLRVGEKIRRPGLFSWREDEALRHTRTVGAYSATVVLPEKAPGVRRVLRLGVVPGMASVRVNGRDAGRASLPPGDLDITELTQRGANLIEIDYRPTLRNWMIGRAAAGDKRTSPFKSRQAALTPTGLTGPISVVEYAADFTPRRH